MEDTRKFYIAKIRFESDRRPEDEDIKGAVEVGVEGLNYPISFVEVLEIEEDK